MLIEEMLNSRLRGTHFASLFLLTEPHRVYPGRLPAPRSGILRRLQALDAQTRNTLDTLAIELRGAPSFDGLAPAELYVLRQRLHCALDFLSMLVDSAPQPGWLASLPAKVELEDRWLLVGIWREYGPLWLEGLATELAKLRSV